jgi:hypothetical protein
MRIGGNVAEARKVFERPQHPATLLQALQIGACHLCYNLCRLAKGAVIDLRIVDVLDIHDRGEIEVDTVTRQVTGVLYPRLPGAIGIACGAERRCRGA